MLHADWRRAAGKSIFHVERGKTVKLGRSRRNGLFIADADELYFGEISASPAGRERPRAEQERITDGSEMKPRRAVAFLDIETAALKLSIVPMATTIESMSRRSTVDAWPVPP